MSIQNVRVDLIDDNPYQPRSSYSTNKIEELAYSFVQVGMRQVPEGRKVGGRFQLAYGHQRKRAFAKLIKKPPKAGHKETLALIKAGTMPLDVKEITDQQMIEYAIEENLRRSDITPMDVARTIELYLGNFKEQTVTSAAAKFNLTQPTVSNMLRVLKCPQEILDKINDGKINFTMARELLIFQGKSAKGTDQGRWDRKSQGYKKSDKDDKWLMLQAVKGIGGQYGPTATVDGIKKSIFNIARDNFPALEKGGSSYYGRDLEPLFDTRAAGCLKCEEAITCYETKTQTRHYCTNTECWEKKQEAHKKKQAAEAKKLADLAVKKQVAEMEAQRQAAGEAAPKPIPQEIAETCVCGHKLEEHAQPDGPCHISGCGCAGYEQDEDNVAALAAVPAPAGKGGELIHAIHTNDAEKVKKLTKSPAEPEPEKKPEMPANVKAAAKDQAGTRAEVLDIRDLRAGSYGELKHGYVLLDTGYSPTIQAMEDPQECTERCTKGFHYAYDSSDTSGRVRFVCTDPKCVTRKKSAFTRAKNAAGQALKRAEMAAIKEAVEKTTRLDRPRMLLILEAAIIGRFTRSYSYSTTKDDILMNILGVQKKEQYESSDDTMKRIRSVVLKATDQELSRYIVEYMLKTFTYDGDIVNYRANTTAYLKLMDVDIHVDGKDGKEAKAEPFPGARKAKEPV